jgi:hypothetical protein
MKRIFCFDLTSVLRSDIVVFVRDNNNYYIQGDRMTTKTRPTSIGDLVTLEGRAASWQCVNTGATMEIYHYNTRMAVVENGTLTQVSRGWGSMTDKCGMAKLRKAAISAGLQVAENIQD